MQFRDELEPDEFDTYYTQENINGPAPADIQPHPPIPAPIASNSETESTPELDSDSAPDPKRSPAVTSQVIDDAAYDLTAATAYFIKHMQGSATPEKTLRQIQQLAKSLKDLKQVVHKPRPVGRPKKRKRHKKVIN